VDEFTIDSSCDGDNGLVVQDRLCDISGESVLTFTGYACEPNDDDDVEEQFASWMLNTPSQFAMQALELKRLNLLP
jgi:hypothetical protein